MQPFRNMSVTRLVRNHKIKRITQIHLLMRSATIIAVLSLFTFISCQNPCANTVCRNDGICINGDCNCAPGFLGAECGTEDIPTKMLLKEVTISRFPTSRSRNDDWDTNSGADLYFVLLKGDEVIYTANTVFEGAETGTLYPFEAINADIEFPESRYLIRWYDSDAPDDDELIGEIEFIPYEEGKAFPRNLSIESGGIEMGMRVSYEFEQ